MRSTSLLKTCFEYDFIALPIDDRLLRSLARLEEQVGTSVFTPVFRKGATGLRAKQFVGVFQLDRLTIQVLPKLYKSSDGTKSIPEAAANLLFLLQYAVRLPKFSGLTTLQQSKLDFLEVLIHLFAINLRSQWQQGASHTYQAVDTVLPVLKGQWRLTEQLREPARQHQFAVTCDEFTADNALNRVLRYVVERLWNISRDKHNRRILGDLKIWMDEVTLLPNLNFMEALTVPMTRLNERFEPLLNLAKLFLSQRSLHLTVGDCQTYGFTFDMNQLFEQFVANFLKQHRSDLPDWLVDCDVKSQLSGKFLAQRSISGTPIFQLKPDIAFQARDKYHLIIDTKYKRLDIGDRNLGVKQEDMYQMCTYAQRFGVDRVLLLYPQTADISEPIRDSFKLFNGETSVYVATVNFQAALTQQLQQKQLLEELHQILENVYGYAN
jgi:5-methylcytosine-specific restriction enzyme subunit McrC